MDDQLFITNYTRFRSLGYNAPLARSTAAAMSTLMQSTSKLSQRKEGDYKGGEVDMFISGYNGETQEMFLHDDVLLPEWESFTSALASIPGDDGGEGYIIPMFHQVQLVGVVQDMLLRAFKTAPLKYLILSDAGLGNEGTSFAAECLNVNMTLEALDIRHHRIESECDAKSLAQTVINHPKIRTLRLINCGVGQSNTVTRAIVPAVNHLKEVSLRSNYIGSFGISLISNCLARNPALESLFLDKIPLRDEDAIMLANSLTTNNKLRKLGLKDNLFTGAGIYALSKVVCNLGSLDAAYDSNKTCFVDDGGELLPKINRFLSTQVNRKLKIHQLLPMSYVHAQNIANMHHITDIPIGTVPRVIGILQEGEGIDPTKYNGLNAVFTFMREWSMPLLYTSRVGPNLRRSQRIREKRSGN